MLSEATLRMVQPDEPNPAPREPTPADTTNAEPLLLSAADLSRELGISARTIRRLDLEGKIPAPVRIGRAVRWRRDEIVEWLAAGAPDRAEWLAIRPN